MKTLYKRIFALLVCITICVGLLPIFNLQVHADGSSVTQVTTSDGSVWVYTPSGYSSSTKYNVLYILEGSGSTGNNALTSTYQSKLDSLISSGQISPIIAVAVPESTYKTNSLTNVISKIDSTYSTNASSSGRIISGFSEGAYHVWNFIINNPTRKDWANVYIPMSPIGYPNEMSGNFGLIRNDTSRIKIYNTCGDSGAEASYKGYTGVGQMEKIVNNGASYGFVEGTNIFRNQVSGDHSWDMVWNALTTVLPSAVKGTAPAGSGGNNGEGGNGSDGSWCKVTIKQGGVGHPSGCTVCSMQLCLQNSGTMTQYQLNGNITSKTTEYMAFEQSFRNAGCSTAGNSGNYDGAVWTALPSYPYAKGFQPLETISEKVVEGIGTKNLADMTKQEQIVATSLFWNAGYWCILIVDYGKYSVDGSNGAGFSGGDHAVMLAGVTKDAIYINDPATGTIRNYNTMNATSSRGGVYNIVGIYAYKNTDATPVALSNGQVDTGGVENEDGSNAADSIGVNAYAYSEEDLSAYAVLGESIDIYNTLYSIDLNDLSPSDRSALGTWEDTIEDGKFSFNKLIRNIIMAFGIILTVWAMLLYTGFWVDRLNNIVDFSFVNLLTFGRLKVADSDEDSNFGKGQKDTFIGHIDVIKICIISILFGVLLITGVFYKILFSLIMFVTNLIKRIF